MPLQSLQFLPRDLRKALRPFQKEGVRYGIEKNGRCLIGDEMGLGKTLQALSIAYYFKEEWPVIIIVPSSLKYTWVDEIEKWLPEVPPEDINLIKGSSDLTALKKAKIHIISYGLISLRNNLNAALLKGINDAKFGVGIVDESHFIKSRKAVRTQKIIDLLRPVKRVILLTGTPSLARPEELFSQISIINPHLVGNWQFFGERYCDGHYILQTARGGKIFRKFDTRGASNLKELHDILKSNVMIRRLKHDVLTELPAKRRQRISFEIGQDSERRKALEKSLKSFKDVVTKFKIQLNEHTDGKLLTMNDVYSSMIVLFRDTGLAKAGAIQEYISDLLDGMPNKFIVFCYHLAVMSAVTEILAKRNTRYVRIAGDVPPEVRASYVKDFQNNPDCRVAVLSITASSMGITLTAADHVVFAELHWTPGVIKQAEDRCHRIGQKNSVQIHFLTARGTIDDLMWSMLSRKLTVTSETLDGETQLLTADDGDQGMNNLLSLCEAWIPDDNDDDVDLFTPKSKKPENENQRDIRSCFLQGTEAKQKGKKRKTRAYYQRGLSAISDASDAEFKPEHKRSKKVKTIGEKESKDTSHDSVQLIIDSDDESNHGKMEEQKIHDVCVSVKPEIRKEDIEQASERKVGICIGTNGLVGEETDMDNHIHSNDSFDNNFIDNEIVPKSWSCPACTFDNLEELYHCEICRTARPVASVRRRSKGCSISDLETEVTEKEGRIGTKDDEKVKESKQRNSVNVQSEIDLPKIFPASGSTLTVINDEPLKNECKIACENTANGGLVIADADVMNLSDNEKDSGGNSHHSNRAGQDAFTEIMSINSDSSSDIDEDWASSACDKKSNNDKDDDKDAGNSLICSGRSTCDNALNSDFCVADAFCTGSSLCNKSSFRSLNRDLENMPSPKSERDRSSIDSPLLFGSSDSANSDSESADNDDAALSGETLFESSRDCGHETKASDQDENDMLAVSARRKAVSQTALGNSNKETTPSKSDCHDTIPDDDMDLSDIFDEDISIPSSEKYESDIEEDEDEVLPVELKFKMSFESDRVYLYNETDEPLGINFRAPDVGIIIADDMPRIFSHPHNMRQLKKFSREWTSLTTTMQRQVRKAGLVFKSPLQVYNELKEARYGSSSKDRFTSKEKLNMKVRTIADMIGGTVTEVKQTENQRYSRKNKTEPDSSSSNQSDNSSKTDAEKVLQAVDTDGSPICLFCNGKVQNGFRAGLLEARFCSYNCKEEHMFRTAKSRIVRERLFATEKGVCQICQFNAHGLFAKLTALRKKDRRSALETTHFKDLPAALLNKIILDPKEGQFWEADHVTAVSEGGGECGLDNYRTLCVPCHREVTKDLNKRLKKIKKLEKAKAEGNMDIGAFFKSASPTSIKVKQHTKASKGSKPAESVLK